MKVDVFGVGGGVRGGVRGGASHVVSMERMFEPPALYCKLFCLHPNHAARKGRLMCASPLLLTRVCVYKGNPCLPALCELMNLCMRTCDNKFSNIPKAVILLENTTEVSACVARSHCAHSIASHSRRISSTGHLVGHPIKGATISPTPCMAFSL